MAYSGLRGCTAAAQCLRSPSITQSRHWNAASLMTLAGVTRSGRSAPAAASMLIIEAPASTGDLAQKPRQCTSQPACRYYDCASWRTSAATSGTWAASAANSPTGGTRGLRRELIYSRAGECMPAASTSYSLCAAKSCRSIAASSAMSSALSASAKSRRRVSELARHHQLPHQLQVYSQVDIKWQQGNQWVEWNRLLRGCACSERRCSFREEEQHVFRG
jgi:hypothetical protein